MKAPMKVYMVNDGDETITFATKTEAMTYARSRQPEVDPRVVVEVEEAELMPLNKAMIVRLINVSGGYIADSRVVAKLPSKRKDGDA